MCKAQLPNHKRCYSGGVHVCLLIRKPKLWNGWAFKAYYTCQLFFSFSSFVRLIFILHSNLFCDIFLSHCKPYVLFHEQTSLCPAMHFAYSNSDKESLFSSYYCYWQVTGRILRNLLKDFQCFAFLFCAFSCLHSFNFTQLLLQSSQIRSAETHYFYFYPLC